MPAVPSRIVIEISAAEQVRLRNHLRRARWGGWLTLHILLLLAQQRSPTAIADWLLCSRSTVYAAAWAWQQGRRPWELASGLSAAPLLAGLTPTRQRSLLALLKKAPSAYGWCRTRWSCAALAETLTDRRALIVASSDLSHFYTQNIANQLDTMLLDCVAAMDVPRLIEYNEQGKAFACGYGAITA